MYFLSNYSFYSELETVFIFLFFPSSPFCPSFFLSHPGFSIWSYTLYHKVKDVMDWIVSPQLISWCPNGTLFGNWAFKVVSEGKWGPEGGTMVHGMSVLMGRKCGHTQNSRNARPQSKGRVRTWWEGGHLQTKDSGPRRKQTCQHPIKDWTSSLPGNKKMNFCCLSHQYVVFCYSSPSKLTQGIKFNLGSSAQSFCHQGPVSWKTVFPCMGWGQGWSPHDSSTLYLLCTLFLLLLY